MAQKFDLLINLIGHTEQVHQFVASILCNSRDIVCLCRIILKNYKNTIKIIKRKKSLSLNK